MKKAFCLFLLFFVCRSARLLYADTYTVDNLPMVYLQDKTKHVVNPDGILSAQTVQQMDSLLYRLETEKGVQSVVAVVERIEGGECYDFAITLGNHWSTVYNHFIFVHDFRCELWVCQRILFRVTADKAGFDAQAVKSVVDSFRSPSST